MKYLKSHPLMQCTYDNGSKPRFFDAGRRISKERYKQLNDIKNRRDCFATIPTAKGYRFLHTVYVETIRIEVQA